MPAFITPTALPFLPSRSQGIPSIHSCTKRTRTHVAMCSQSPSSSDEPDPLGSISRRDWREFRAALVAGSAEALEQSKQKAYREGHWAHPLSLPENGCFLASHPAYYRRSAPYLTQAVVFITSYSRRDGAIGLVLNRPFQGTVAEIEKEGTFGRSSELRKTKLSDEPVYAGGPDLVQSGVMTVLHGSAAGVDIESMTQPLDGVYVGGLEGWVKGVEEGAVEARKGRLFAGCIRWKQGELEKEVDEGSWYCIAASPLFALKHCLQLPKPLWVEIMQSQGHPFTSIANRVYREQDGAEEV